MKEIDLNSVNWWQGMTVMPDHLLGQERYVDSLAMWLLRYDSDAYGLAGAGARVERAERGAAKHDPIVDVVDDGEVLRISITQCRGISPSGDIIDIDPSHPIHEEFPKANLAEQRELGVYVVCQDEKKTDGEGEDQANPMSRAWRRRDYRIELGANAAAARHSLMVSRVHRPEDSPRFEQMSEFIPVSTTMVSHSELKRAWELLCGRLASLSDRYLRLHRAIVEYIHLAGESRFDTRGDEETLLFAGRMVATLESTLNSVINPLQSPRHFFQSLYSAIRNAAIYLDLSAPTRTFFLQLAEAGENEFRTLLEQERKTLEVGRELTIHDNLRIYVQQIEQAIKRLGRLEEALEGKYLDYRVSTALESLSFFFELRGDSPVLYQIQKKPASAQYSRDGEALFFVFAPPLNLEGDCYRLVLIREANTPIERDERIKAEIQLNAGTGPGFEPLREVGLCELTEQRNFAIDFRRPANIPVISDIRVVVPSRYPIRSCLLYRRRVLEETGSRFPRMPVEGSRTGNRLSQNEPLSSQEAPRPASSRLSGRLSEPEPPPRPGRFSEPDERTNDPVPEPKVRRRRLE